jgi:hypothetical protein
MQARAIQNNASFGPEALKVIGQAFDEAWASIAGNFNEGVQTENARSKLARAVLSVASDESRDAAALRHVALQVMKTNWEPSGGSELRAALDDSQHARGGAGRGI